MAFRVRKITAARDSAIGTAAAIMLVASDTILWNPVVKAVTIVVVLLVSPSAANAETHIMETTIADNISRVSRFFQVFILFTSLSSESMP